MTLWRDHLPALSIEVQSDKGYKVNFYLVKDATVTPQRGRTVDIPVEEWFTLPAGQTHYRFPLQQGEGNKEMRFVAYLMSPAFPLKKDTTCKLKMTYTYGADDPYELKFLPLDSAEAGFKSVRVEWRSASERGLPIWRTYRFRISRPEKAGPIFSPSRKTMVRASLTSWTGVAPKLQV